MPMPSVSLLFCDSRCVIIAVSYSGSSVQLLSALQTATENGATIILITSHKNSPASRLADYTLIGIGPEVRHNSESSVSRLIHMAIGDVLYTRVSFMQKGFFEENLQKMREGISTLKS